MPHIPQATSNNQVAVATKGDEETRGTHSGIKPSALTEDGTHNVRKRRAEEEACDPKATVKVRKKGNGASESAEQVCEE